MKKIRFSIFLLILCAFLGACGGAELHGSVAEEGTAGAQNSVSVEENAELQNTVSEDEKAEFQYPEPEEFGRIFSEAGLVHWTPRGEGRKVEGSEEYFFSEEWCYELLNQEGRIRCQVLIYMSHAETVGVQIGFLPMDHSVDAAPLTEEENARFLSEELPELWTLASKLCSDSEAVLEVQKRMEADYERVLAPEQYVDQLAYFSEWGAQSGGICGTACLMKQDENSLPMWCQIKLVSGAEYNDSRMLNGKTSATVQTLMQEKEYVVDGRLSEITEAGDFSLSFAQGASNLPANISFYQKAVLTDESGSLPVYIAPTALSKEELGSRRKHLLQKIQGRYDCYVITKSCREE